jgi:hypothetical protein
LLLGPKRLVAAVVTAVVTMSLLAQAALADATPVQLILLYMPNVSNTDTPKASGIAELVMLEGEVRIKTADLPRLDGDQRYVAWVVNSGSNEFQRLGAFNTSEATGAVAFETVLPDAIPNKHWNLLLVTVEENAEPAKPSSKHSIAGLFPSADNVSLPIVLPNTGGRGDELLAMGCQPLAITCQLSAVRGANWLATSGLVTLMLAVTFVAGYAVGRRRSLSH